MYRISIIEDDKIIRNELKILLEKYGYDVIVLEKFENIVQAVLVADPQLILLHINLPVYDGYHICRGLRKFSQVPIIIVTSRNSDLDELMSMNLGADDFITKPYNTQILLARIGEILNRTYHKGRITSRDDIMNELWQSNEFVDDNTLTVNINRLRKKLVQIGAVDLLKTKRRQGYSL